MTQHTSSRSWPTYLNTFALPPFFTTTPLAHFFSLNYYSQAYNNHSPPRINTPTSPPHLALLRQPHDTPDISSSIRIPTRMQTSRTPSEMHHGQILPVFITGWGDLDDAECHDDQTDGFACGDWEVGLEIG